MDNSDMELSDGSDDDTIIFSFDPITVNSLETTNNQVIRYIPGLLVDAEVAPQSFDSPTSDDALYSPMSDGILYSPSTDDDACSSTTDYAPDSPMTDSSLYSPINSISSNPDNSTSSPLHPYSPTSDCNASFPSSVQLISNSPTAEERWPQQSKYHDTNYDPFSPATSSCNASFPSSGHLISNSPTAEERWPQQSKYHDTNYNPYSPATSAQLLSNSPTAEERWPQQSKDHDTNYDPYSPATSSCNASIPSNTQLISNSPTAEERWPQQSKYHDTNYDPFSPTTSTMLDSPTVACTSESSIDDSTLLTTTSKRKVQPELNVSYSSSDSSNPKNISSILVNNTNKRKALKHQQRFIQPLVGKTSPILLKKTKSKNPLVSPVTYCISTKLEESKMGLTQTSRESRIKNNTVDTDDTSNTVNVLALDSTLHGLTVIPKIYKKQFLNPYADIRGCHFYRMKCEKITPSCVLDRQQPLRRHSSVDAKGPSLEITEKDSTIPDMKDHNVYKTSPTRAVIRQNVEPEGNAIEKRQSSLGSSSKEVSTKHVKHKTKARLNKFKFSTLGKVGIIANDGKDTKINEDIPALNVSNIIDADPLKDVDQIGQICKSQEPHSVISNISKTTNVLGRLNEIGLNTKLKSPKQNIVSSCSTDDRKVAQFKQNKKDTKLNKYKNCEGNRPPLTSINSKSKKLIQNSANFNLGDNSTVDTTKTAVSVGPATGHSSKRTEKSLVKKTSPLTSLKNSDIINAPPAKNTERKKYENTRPNVSNDIVKEGNDTTQRLSKFAGNLPNSESACNSKSLAEVTKKSEAIGSVHSKQKGAPRQLSEFDLCGVLYSDGNKGKVKSANLSVPKKKRLKSGHHCNIDMSNKMTMIGKSAMKTVGAKRKEKHTASFQQISQQVHLTQKTNIHVQSNDNVHTFADDNFDDECDNGLTKHRLKIGKSTMKPEDKLKEKDAGSFQKISQLVHVTHETNIHVQSNNTVHTFTNSDPNFDYKCNTDVPNKIRKIDKSTMETGTTKLKGKDTGSRKNISQLVRFTQETDIRVESNDALHTFTNSDSCRSYIPSSTSTGVHLYYPRSKSVDDRDIVGFHIEMNSLLSFKNKSEDDYVREGTCPRKGYYFNNKSEIRSFLHEFTERILVLYDYEFNTDNIYPIFLKFCQHAGFRGVTYTPVNDPPLHIWDLNIRQLIINIFEDTAKLCEDPIQHDRNILAYFDYMYGQL